MKFELTPSDMRLTANVAAYLIRLTYIHYVANIFNSDNVEDLFK